MTNRLNLGCGGDIRPGWTNVDARAVNGVDCVHDLRERPWPWADDSIQHVLASHVLEHLNDVAAALEECARLLQPEGQLDVRMPMGANAVADPDHKHRWSWRTPICYCGARPWDVNVGLEVISRDIDLTVTLPRGAGRLYGLLLDTLRRVYGSGKWCFGLPATVGEFRVVFEA